MPEDDLNEILSPDEEQKLAADIGRNLGFPFQNVLGSDPDDTDTPAPEDADTPDETQETEPDADSGEAADDSASEDETDVLKVRQGFSKKLNKQAQELASLRNEMKAHTDKAKAFDAIFNAADPAKAVEDIKRSLGVQSSPTVTPEIRAATIENISSRIPKQLKDKFEAPNDVVELVMHVIEQGLIPSLRPYQAAVEQFVLGQAKSETDTVLQEFPTAKPYMDEAKKISAQTGWSLRKSLISASEGKVLQDQKRVVRREKVANGSQFEAPAIGRRQVRSESRGDVSDDQLAAELVEIDRKTGTNRYFPNKLMRRIPR